MAYSIGSSQDDCYPGTTVLINKPDLRNQAALDQAERVIVTLRAAELGLRTYTEPFTFDFYRMLHRELFQDLYAWAGELRTIDLSKKGTRFYPAAELLRYGQAKFRYLAEENEFRGIPKDELVVKAADFYHEVKQAYFADDPHFCERSWGMSDDYLLAVNHESTMVRVGTAIFGPRKY